jgi:GT2 family glycosyltransferase
MSDADLDHRRQIPRITRFLITASPLLVGWTLHSARRWIWRVGQPSADFSAAGAPAGSSDALTPASSDEIGAKVRENAGPEPKHEIAVVVLTQADRPTELERAIASVRAQQQVDLQLVLVINGAHSPQPQPSDRLIMLPENVGIPGGRNVGATAADAQLVMFLDDDAELLDSGLLAAVVDRFKADPRLGAMAIRLIDEHGCTQRRHVPRLGARSAERSGPVTYFIGAACVVRAATFYGVEGFDARFFYAMEESDLSWRLLDAGWSIWYSADLKAFHPRTAPSRHNGYARLTARNRLWMAWRSLPVPMFAGYLLTWTGVAVARGVPVREMLAGYQEAWSARPVRHPIRWRTVVRMTLLGRPPIV